MGWVGVDWIRLGWVGLGFELNKINLAQHGDLGPWSQVLLLGVKFVFLIGSITGWRGLG